jgi:hypothetical protein
MQFAQLALAAAPLIGGLFGKRRASQTPTLSPQQQEIFSQLQQGLTGQGPLSYLSPQGATQNFQELVADPQLQYFQNRTVPAIQQGFIGNNLGRSSLNQDALIRAGSQVQSNLDQMLFNAQQNAMGRGAGVAQNLLNPSFQATPAPQQDPFQQLLGGLAPAGGQAFGDVLSQILGSFGGGQAGGQAGGKRWGFD